METKGRATYFDLMVKSSRKTGEVINPDLMFDDIFSYTIAGMDSVGYIMSFGTYFLITNPEVLGRLEKELCEARPFIQQFDHRKIMALPYLVWLNVPSF